MSDSAETQDTVAIVPSPPRYWWLKRLAIAGVLLLSAVACLRLWWGVVAQRRLDAAIAAIVARGEPVFPEDFDQQPVPDEDNATILYQRASEALIAPSGEFTLADVVNDPEIVTERLEEVRKIVEENCRAIELVREARSRSAVYWQAGQPSVANSRPRSLMSFGELARLIAAAAICHHEVGNDHAAIELLGDVVRLGRAVGEALPTLLSTLMETVIVGHAAAACEHIASGISLADGPLNQASGAHEASRNEIGALISEFVNERRMRERWEIGLWGERAFQMDAVRLILSGKLIFSRARGAGMRALKKLAVIVTIFAYGPAYRLDAIRLLENMTRLSALGSDPNVPAARTRKPDMPRFDRLLDRQTRYLSMLIMPQFGGTWPRLVSDWTRQALVGVMLAIRLYEIDHGRRPQTLQLLVPEYLPRVPTDLMAADGRAVAYVGDGEQPRVYSVGMNARDDGGRHKKPTRAARRGGQTLPDDIIVYLNGKPGESAAAQPSDAQRVENRDDVERQPRDP